MEQLSIILPVIVFLAFSWVTYVTISLFWAIRKSKKSDKTLVLALSKNGKIFYGVMITIQVVLLFVSAYFFVAYLLEGDTNAAALFLNILTVFSIGSCYLLQQIIYVGNRQMLIGKVILDYRKVKRVTYEKDNTLHFTYGQRTYHTSLRFIDRDILKRSLQKCR